MIGNVTYDEALPRFAAIVAEAVGKDHVYDHWFLREANGKLSLIVQPGTDPEVRARIASLAAVLAPWVDRDLPVVDPSYLFDFDSDMLDQGLPERIEHENFTGFVRLLERRIVGQDWLRPPREPLDGAPPVVIFASYKGGVGRSTALAVAAAAFSERNLNVLVIDLDLEAPGLGDMLLTDLPLWGTLDFFVEDGAKDLTNIFFDDMIGTSTLASKGLIHVAPAVGSVSGSHPQNVLGKIGRAYLERVLSDGGVETFLDRVRRLVASLSARHRYDAIFVDARAGLNEATAAAVLGLGGEVLLFGVDTPQTFSGYTYFLAHLSRFRPATSTDDDWRYRLRFIHAKAQANSDAHARFRTESFEIFSSTLYDSLDGLEASSFNFDYDDQNAPHYAWPILSDSNFAEFNPIARRDQFSSSVYEQTFGLFLSALADKIGVSW